MRLLVGLDDSGHGRDALELARVLCTATGASALVVAVPFGGPLPTSFDLLPADDAGLVEPLFATARERLAGIEVETRAYVGSSPAAVLTALSEHEDVDGIVIGSPHRSGVGRLVLGSTATAVLNGAATDVYIAPPRYAEAAHDGLAKVGVAFVGSPESKVALERALELVDDSGRIELLVVVEPPVPLSHAGQALTSPIDGDLVIAEGLKLVPAEVAVEGRRLDGPAAQELEKAGGEGLDLLVVGSRGYGPLQRVLLGSVSGHVFRHAPCPVLVTRRP